MVELSRHWFWFPKVGDQAEFPIGPILQTRSSFQMDFDVRRNLVDALSRDQDFESVWETLHAFQLSGRQSLVVATFFWPPLVSVEGYVFIAQNFDVKYYNELKIKHGERVEETINTVYLSSYFDLSADSHDDIERLGFLISTVWAEWAQIQFPDKKFLSRFNWYSEGKQDPGVTLHQNYGV
jgi:hypothetical protein